MFGAVVSCSLTSGPLYPCITRTGVGAYRIRPPRRRKRWLNELVMCSLISFHFRPHQGVCDTPLHLFDWFPGFIGLHVGFVFADLRAYAIRPYTCLIVFWNLLGCVLVSFSRTWRACAIRPYTYSIISRLYRVKTSCQINSPFHRVFILFTANNHYIKNRSLDCYDKLS